MNEIAFEQKGNNIINSDDIFQKSIDKLMENNVSLSCAESCTGGGFAAKLTEFSGISKIFDRGIVTYSNEAKISELGVKKETLESYGAVSFETAFEMAKGIKKVSKTDLGISVTGIAGPLGGSEKKPVGLVYIGIVYGEISKVRELRFLGNRNENRLNSIKNMFEMIYEIL